MENKINVAELLKDCPKGTELYSPLVGDCKFVKVHDYESQIIVKLETGATVAFLSDGRYFDYSNAECILFPSKEKTTWEGFVPPYKFKDGDIYYIKDVFGLEFISIIKKCENDKLYTYVDISISNNGFYWEGSEGLCYCKNIIEHRLATEEEKKKLFDAIKSHGYKWNEKTKTLEKLIKPKFKVGDIIQDITGICKVKITEVNVEDEYYFYKSLNINGIGVISFNRQNDWKLVPTKFDIATLKPFDKVLVRDNNTQKWTADVFSFFDKSLVYPYSCVGHYTNQCIPYEGNEHLLGTTDDCDEYFKNW